MKNDDDVKPYQDLGYARPKPQDHKWVMQKMEKEKRQQNVSPLLQEFLDKRAGVSK